MGERGLMTGTLPVESPAGHLTARLGSVWFVPRIRSAFPLTPWRQPIRAERLHRISHDRFPSANRINRLDRPGRATPPDDITRNNLPSRHRRATEARFAFPHLEVGRRLICWAMKALEAVALAEACKGVGTADSLAARRATWHNLDGDRPQSWPRHHASVAHSIGRRWAGLAPAPRRHVCLARRSDCVVHLRR